jgi:hypothetical protein
MPLNQNRRDRRPELGFGEQADDVVRAHPVAQFLDAARTGCARRIDRNGPCGIQSVGVFEVLVGVVEDDERKITDRFQLPCELRIQHVDAFKKGVAIARVGLGVCRVPSAEVIGQACDDPAGVLGGQPDVGIPFAVSVFAVVCVSVFAVLAVPVIVPMILAVSVIVTMAMSMIVTVILAVSVIVTMAMSMIVTVILAVSMVVVMRLPYAAFAHREQLELQVFHQADHLSSFACLGQRTTQKSLEFGADPDHQVRILKQASL